MSIAHTTLDVSNKALRYERITPQASASSSQGSPTIEADTAHLLRETVPTRPIWIPPYYLKGAARGQDYDPGYTRPPLWVRTLSSGGVSSASAVAGIYVMYAIANALRSHADQSSYSFSAAIHQSAPKSTASYLLTLLGTAAGSYAGAPLNSLPYSSYIANTASYTYHRMRHLSRRPLPDIEQGNATVPLGNTMIPLGQKNWGAGNQELTMLPKFPHTLEFIDVSHNRLETLSPESFRELIEHRSSKNKGIVLNLSNNSFRTVPRFLFDLHFRSFINLEHNPISPEEIKAVDAEKKRRELRGLSNPVFVFHQDNEYAEDANVHTHKVDFIMQKNLHALVVKFPNVVVDNQVRKKLLADIHTCAARYAEQLQPQSGNTPILKLAAKAIEHMWTDAESREVLAYVQAFIDSKPEGPERDQGIIQLLLHLSFAQGNDTDETDDSALCLYRHRAEALTALSSAYTDVPNCLPFSAVRDLLFAQSQKILQKLLAEMNLKTPVEQVQAKFETSFRAAMHEQNIPNEHITQFIKDFAFAEWETFCEMAMPDENVTQHRTLSLERPEPRVEYHPLEIE